MDVKKAVKKVVAFGAGTAMLGATLFGAMAADLAEYPAPFVDGGQADFYFVLGARANVADVLGTVDIATSLQAESVTKTAVACGGATEAVVAGGVAVETSGDKLNLFEALGSANAQFTKTDFPVLLADGKVTEETDNEDYEYTQKIKLTNNATVQFDRSDVSNDFTSPVLNLDLGSSSSAMIYELEIDFAKNLNITLLTDSEDIVMFGKTFTFDTSLDLDDEIVLYGASQTTSVTVGESATVGGVEVEVVGANAEASPATAIIKVNGVTKQVDEGDYVTVGGVELYIKDIFVQTIPTSSAAVNFFVGSSKWTLPAADTTQTFTSEVEVGSTSMDGVTVWVESASADNNGDVTAIHFYVQPYKFDEKIKYLEIGDKIVDPLFGTFEMTFAGATPDLDDDSKNYLYFQGGDTITMYFTNEEGEDISIELFEWEDSDLYIMDEWEFGKYINGSNQVNGSSSDAILDEDDYFIYPDGTRYTVFDVSRIYTDNSVAYVDFYDRGSEVTHQLQAGEILVGSLSVSSIDTTNSQVTMSAAPWNANITLKDDVNVQLLTVDSAWSVEGTRFNISVHEYSSNIEETSDVSAVVFNFLVEEDPGSDTDVDIGFDDFAVSGTANTNYDKTSDKDDDFTYTLSEFGTYAIYDGSDNAKDSVEFWYPAREGYFKVFFAPIGSELSEGGAGTTESYMVNPIPVGLAVLDSVAIDEGYYGAQNVIVMGGPCANDLAAELLGQSGANCAAGFVEGKAKVRLFEENDKVALVVAGGTATDTQGASRVLANYGNYPTLVGDEVEVVVTSLAAEPTVQQPTVEGDSPVSMYF